MQKALSNLTDLLEKLPDRQADRLYKTLSTVKLGNKELFGHRKIIL